MKKSKHVVNKFFPGHQTGGHRGKSKKQTLLGFSLSASFNLYYYAKVIFPSFSMFFYLNSFRQVRGEVKGFILSLFIGPLSSLFFNSTLLIMLLQFSQFFLLCPLHPSPPFSQAIPTPLFMSMGHA